MRAFFCPEEIDVYPVDELEDRLECLRTPYSYNRDYLGVSIGPYVQGNPENGYGGRQLQEIRLLRKQIAICNVGMTSTKRK